MRYAMFSSEPMSFTATSSRSGVSRISFSAARPIRPRPFIPTRVVISLPPARGSLASFNGYYGCDNWLHNGPHRCGARSGYASTMLLAMRWLHLRLVHGVLLYEVHQVLGVYGLIPHEVGREP